MALFLTLKMFGILFIFFKLPNMTDTFHTISVLEYAKCREPVGMESGGIPDSAITASSIYDDIVGPDSARIRTEIKGGAWCPKSVINPSSYEYLQIDLGKLMVITMVETQGRFGNGQTRLNLELKGQEFARWYRLEYLVEDGGDWIQYEDATGSKIIEGNDNTYRVVSRNINPPIIAEQIRFIPYSREHITVCMRVELYGCPLYGFLVPTTCDPSCISFDSSSSSSGGFTMRCECPSTTQLSTTQPSKSSHTPSPPTSLPTTAMRSTNSQHVSPIKDYLSAKTTVTLPGVTTGKNPSTDCVKVLTHDGTITGSDLIAGSQFQNDCQYLIDLGPWYQSGQTYVHVIFESMQLHECTNCSCDYLQFENSEFSQRICSYKDIQINRPYKLKPQTVERYLRLHYHSQHASMPTDFRLLYLLEWGNSTNVCEAVTCKTKCPYGIIQDFVGCPMCKCVGDVHLRSCKDMSDIFNRRPLQSKIFFLINWTSSFLILGVSVIYLFFFVRNTLFHVHRVGSSTCHRARA